MLSFASMKIKYADTSQAATFQRVQFSWLQNLAPSWLSCKFLTTIARL